MGQGRPAFLFRLDSVVNVEECGEPRKQELSTGEYALIGSSIFFFFKI